jgi:hypothetical protein
MLKHLPEARLMPHPYLRSRPERDVRTNAVAFSRIDFDKHTDIIAEANELLDPSLRCHIYGAINSMYDFHKLAKSHPNWKRMYRSAPTADALWPGAVLSSRARFAVDMSAIAGDGGGTQYTFLEAMDGGATLVLNSAWTIGPEDEMYDQAVYVHDGRSLAAVLSRPEEYAGPDRTRGYDDILARHDATAIARRLLKTLEG